MSVTIRILHDIELHDTQHLYAGEIDFDSSYPTGGESVDPANNSTFEVLLASSKNGYVFSWDKANQKLKAFVSKDPGAAGGADVVLQEVADTTNLSSVTGVQFLAVGF